MYLHYRRAPVLPKKLQSFGRFLGLLPNKLEFYHNKNYRQRASVRTDVPFPVPKDSAAMVLNTVSDSSISGCAYYEITIKKVAATPCAVGIGLAVEEFQLESKMVGWENGSFG